MKERIKNSQKTHYCNQLNRDNIDEEVILAGWVNKRRDHGGLIFVDLRDRSGLVQLVISPDENPEAFKVAEKVRNEFVLKVQGRVRHRPKGTVNPDLETGQIEVFIEKLEILNSSLTPPFEIEDEVSVDEKIRLKYRYLDLRRPVMAESIMFRHQVTGKVRQFLDRNDFIEVETPILTKSTPEGARDYLVPSRVSQGHFYALPQSPQLFKQLLMIAGLERYYQIARCFRDEDLRADRQPEHTQVDIEMSFIECDDLLALVEEMIKDIFSLIKVEIDLPFPRLTYDQAMLNYGSDKPDLRYELEINDVTDIFDKTAFKVFSGVIEKDGVIRALVVPGGISFTRKKLDELIETSKEFGAGGLVWLQLKNKQDIKSPVAKYLSEQEVRQLIKQTKANSGDLILIVADQERIAAEALGGLRSNLASDLKLIKEDSFNMSWILDFPLFEYDTEEKRHKSNHHPFTRPTEDTLAFLEKDPLKVKAYAYDLILNGVEIGGGSLRIHNQDLQRKIFKILGIEAKEAESKFGFLLEALKYGAPPHGGIAFGLDRMIMVMTRKKSIRDVIAFPKTQAAACLLTKAPNLVKPEQLKELHLRLRK